VNPQKTFKSLSGKLCIAIDQWLQDMPSAQQSRQKILKDLEGKFIEILDDPPGLALKFDMAFVTHSTDFFPKRI
jgi:hypothetical protein